MMTFWLIKWFLKLQLELHRLAIGDDLVIANDSGPEVFYYNFDAS